MIPFITSSGTKRPSPFEIDDQSTNKQNKAEETGIKVNRRSPEYFLDLRQTSLLKSREKERPLREKWLFENLGNETYAQNSHFYNSAEYGKLLFEYINMYPTTYVEHHKFRVQDTLFQKLFTFSEGQTITLPLCLWNVHSSYFGSMAISQMQQKSTLVDENISVESIQMFIRSLEQCSSSESLNVNNYLELRELANKYSVTWLAEDCAKFFKQIYNPSIDAHYQNSDNLRSSLNQFIRDEVEMSLSNLIALEKLADDYQLADFKLYARLGLIRGNGIHILRDNSTLCCALGSGYMDYQTIVGLVRKSLTMKNLWHSPNIELKISVGPTRINVFNDLKMIFEEAKIGFGLKLTFTSSVPENLAEMLNKIPQLKSLKINFDGFNFDETKMEKFAQAIKNTSWLQSLYITIDSTETKKGDIYSNILRRAVDLNETLEEVDFTIVGVQLDRNTGDSVEYFSVNDVVCIKKKL